MSLILITILFYKAVILQGEIWRWSLLGLKGLKMPMQNIMQTFAGETRRVMNIQYKNFVQFEV